MRAKEVEIIVDSGEQDIWAGGAVPTSAVKVTNARVEHDEFGGFTVRAQLENNLDIDISQIADVFVVLRNSSGDVVGGIGGVGLDNDIKAGRRTAFETSSFLDLKGVTDADVSVDPNRPRSRAVSICIARAPAQVL